MPTVVGTLQVDLVANTATFSYDLGQAGDKANEFGKRASEGFGSAREGAMLLEEATGVRLPRALTGLLSNIGPLGAAFQAMLPVAGVVAAIGIINELVEKHQKAREEITKSWDSIDAAFSKWTSHSKEELIALDIEIDELNNDHLKALSDRLKQIDMQSLDELREEFSKTATEVDGALAKMQSSSVMTFIGMGNNVDEVRTKFGEAMKQINADIARGDKIAAAWDIDAAVTQFHMLGQPISDAVNLLRAGHNETAALKLSEDAYYQAVLTGTEALENQKTQLDTNAEAEAKKTEIATRKAHPPEKPTVLIDEYLKNLNAMEKAHEETAHKTIEDNERMAASQRSADEAMREESIKLQTSQIKDTEASGVAQEVVAQAAAKSQLSILEKLHSTGLISEQDYIGSKLALLHEEQRAREAALQDQINAQSSLESLNRGSDPEKANAALGEKLKLQGELATSQKAYAAAVADTNLEETKAQQSWQTWAQRMQSELPSLGASIRGNLQEAIQRAETQFADSTSRMIVEGGNLKQSMLKVAENMMEAMISSAIKIGEQWLVTHLLMAAEGKAAGMAQIATAAGIAGANMTASFAAAPWPIDMGAPAAGAEAAAVAMSFAAFSQGGIVPGFGNGDSVHAMLTPEEMVLPKSISIGLSRMIAAGEMDTPGRNGGDTHYHNSPTYHMNMIDGTGVDRMLEEHNESFSRHTQSEMRKRHQ